MECVKRVREDWEEGEKRNYIITCYYVTFSSLVQFISVQFSSVHFIFHHHQYIYTINLNWKKQIENIMR